MNEAKHSLTDRDTSTMTATCSVCGPVGIRTSGTGYQCSVKKAAAHQQWAKGNPEKAAANRRSRSDHRLSGKDTEARKAVCSVCGPVALTPWGRGFACANLAASRRTVQEKAPSGFCRECQIIDDKLVWLKADGVCPSCSDTEDRWSHIPAERRDPGGRQAADLDWLGLEVDEDEQYGTGFSLSDDPEAYSIPEEESAVYGWKTLGHPSKPWNEV